MADQISSRANRSYQTTYRREYVLKRSPSIAEGIPLGQQFPVSSPYRLEGPIGSSIYAVDYFKENKVQREEFPRPNTNRANRPHPHRDFPFWPRRAESLGDLSAEDTEQALKNQLNSTYRADFTGAAQGFPLSLAYKRSRPYWRDRALHTLDSEYRFSYQDLSKEVSNPHGRYGCSPRTPADAIVPQTLPLWKKRTLKSIYSLEICDKPPTDLYFKDFVDSLGGPMD